MDSCQDKKYNEDYPADNSPLVGSQDAKRMLIQLEGSHTTSTATESVSRIDKKNVKFEDDQEKKGNSNEDVFQEVEHSRSNLKMIEALGSKATNEDFGKICKPEDIELRYWGLADKQRSISTITINRDVKNVACQTQWADLTSLNEFSLVEVSSLTSRSEQANSLNNYAQAENACISNYNSQQEIRKQPLAVPITSLPSNTTELPATQSFNIITIETEATPSPAELRREPLCQRLWNVFCDFCAATFLCLQVNRDCIFCLGFFAAFVVSASFLTAFFYHTLVMSPALWQTADNSYF